VFNRQLIFRAVVSRLHRQHQSEDDGELKDPLPDKLRSSVVRSISLLRNSSAVILCLLFSYVPVYFIQLQIQGIMAKRYFAIDVCMLYTVYSVAWNIMCVT